MEAIDFILPSYMFWGPIIAIVFLTTVFGIIAVHEMGEGDNPITFAVCLVISYILVRVFVEISRCLRAINWASAADSTITAVLWIFT